MDRYEVDDDIPPQRSYLLKSMDITTYSGEKISVPKYERFPPYFERFGTFDVKKKEQKPFQELEVKYSDDKPLLSKYTPKTYRELISDESCNKQVMGWLRHFQTMKVEKKSKKSRRAKKLSELKANEEPTVKMSHILLLAGPPGCGKTTLIRVVAAHCGYHTVELNASDDVTVERNQMILQDQIQFKPVFGKKTKPLLVFEELDGAGTIHESIQKAIFGMATRPVVVVVNDPYTASLRNIRLASTLVKMPHPRQQRLVDCLKNICRKENIEAQNQALADIVQTARFDLTQSLNMLSFLRLRQPITSEVVKLVPVGEKNASLTMYNVWDRLMTSTTSLEAALDMLDAFNNNRRIGLGLLEIVDKTRANDPGHYKMCEMLDDLCYADAATPEFAALGLAAAPRLIGVPHPDLYNATSRQLQEYENMAARGATAMMHHSLFRLSPELVRFYLNPPVDEIRFMTSPRGEWLRQRFVEFHRQMGITYKLNGQRYFMVPDLEDFLNIGHTVIGELQPFRECIQNELEKSRPVREIGASKSITDTINQRKSSRPIRNFWGEVIELDATQTQTQHAPKMVYRHNEGYTNAVKRRVLLERLLM